MFSLPFFDKLESAQTVLLAGCGGGYDFCCGLPLYDQLRRAGKTVHLANLSFSDVRGARGNFLAPGLLEVTADTLGNESYFPELHFARWMRERGEETAVWTFAKTGVAPLARAYTKLVEYLRPDALILVDGGTDSLMRGDEFGLGTPIEDVASILAAAVQDVPFKSLVSLGFGVDSFHGVCHAQWLEAVADLTRRDAYLGCWSLMRGAPETEFYRAACEAIFERMPRSPSIVSGSILNAIDGYFGDHHSTSRTRSSKLFINPLMALSWAFDLEAVAKRLLYPEEMADTETMGDMASIIDLFRLRFPHKPFESLPM